MRVTCEYTCFVIHVCVCERGVECMEGSIGGGGGLRE